MHVYVSLSPELVGLLHSKIDSGQYDSASDVVSEALRLLERAEEAESLRDAWDVGIASGDAGVIDFAALKQQARAKLAATHA